MKEFTIQGAQYRAGKLDAFKQLAVSRRLGPILPTLLPIFTKAKALFDAGPAAGDGLSGVVDIAEAAKPFLNEFAAMPDEAVETIVRVCLSVVLRQQGTSWAPIYNESNRTLMFDLNLNDVLPIVFQVIVDSLGNFIPGTLTNLPASGPEKT